MGDAADGGASMTHERTLGLGERARGDAPVLRVGAGEGFVLLPPAIDGRSPRALAMPSARPLPAPGEPFELAAMLDWSHRLAPGLTGRDSELAGLVSWAQTGRRVRAAANRANSRATVEVPSPLAAEANWITRAGPACGGPRAAHSSAISDVRSTITRIVLRTSSKTLTQPRRAQVRPEAAGPPWRVGRPRQANLLRPAGETKAEKAGSETDIMI